MVAFALCGCHPCLGWHCQPASVQATGMSLMGLMSLMRLMSSVTWAEPVLQKTQWERIPDGEPGKSGSVGGSPQPLERAGAQPGEHRGQGMQVRQEVLTTAPDPGTPRHLPFQRDPGGPLGWEEASGAAGGHCWLCPGAEPTAGSVHPGSISSRAPGLIKGDLSSL